MEIFGTIKHPLDDDYDDYSGVTMNGNYFTYPIIYYTLWGFKIMGIDLDKKIFNYMFKHEINIFVLLRIIKKTISLLSCDDIVILIYKYCGLYKLPIVTPWCTTNPKQIPV